MARYWACRCTVTRGWHRFRSLRAPRQISVGRVKLQKICCNFASGCCDNVRAMTYILPPMNPLRAFEAAARHLSFKLAAHELHVTPGAVGQQVKALEDRLGVRLFERLHKQLILTPAGQEAVAAVQQ